MNKLSTSLLMAGAAFIHQGAFAQHASNKQQAPNIIWITCEDLSPYMGCFGDDVIHTPNIDRLAAEGERFTRVYTTAGVSSPSRSCIITGMYPISIGTQHMRTLIENPEVSRKIGVPKYSAVLPHYVKAFPEYLRQAGYYTTNNQKTDYQFIEPVTVWDECSAAATYRNDPQGKPFFSVFNLFITHESQMMKESPLYKGHEDLKVDPAVVKLPPYYTDTPTARADMARLLSNAQLMDYHVGEIIAQLKRDGVYDNSYIFFFSDHGGAMPWSKREILERGTHIPFIVKYPKGAHAGKVNHNLISSVDFAPTVLSLAGVEIPQHMQGQAFLGSQATSKSRCYVFAGRDRLDECYDRVRSVRDSRFRYIYNFNPDQPRYMHVTYRLGIPVMREILALHEQGKLKPGMEAWFAPTKPIEELYDVEADPHEMHNLASDPAYKDKLEELRKAFRGWLGEVGDMSYMSEAEMVKNWWKGENHAPFTSMPELQKTANGYTLTCATRGASIGYKIIEAGQTVKKVKTIRDTHDMDLVIHNLHNGEEIEEDSPWQVYKTGQVLKLKPGEKLLVNARRIGYEPAEKCFEL